MIKGTEKVHLTKKKAEIGRALTQYFLTGDDYAVYSSTARRESEKRQERDLEPLGIPRLQKTDKG